MKDFTQCAFDVIIQAGQSNAEGYGFGPVENPYHPTDRVWYLNPDLTISQATEQVRGNEIQSNFSLSFAREYLKNGYLAQGRDLLIVRSAVGGTGFSDHRWGMCDDLYLRMMEMVSQALALNPQNRLVAFLWHQGENDANYGASFEEHKKNLQTLVDSAFKTFNVPELPFIAGDFVQHWKGENVEKCEPVISAIRAVCESCKNGAFVETDGLLSNEQELHRAPLGWKDIIHFSRVAVYALGERYFEAFRQMKERG
jgi:hypothetical protein